MAMGLLAFAVAGCVQDREQLVPEITRPSAEMWPVQPASFDEWEPTFQPLEVLPLPLEPLPGSSSGPLTLKLLEEIALASNPTLLQADAQIDAASGRWVQVGLTPNPLIGFSGGEIGNESQAGQHGLFVRQQFVTHGKLGLNQEVAAREIEGAEQRAYSQRLRVLTDVRLGYYEMLIAQQRVSITDSLQGISLEAVQTIGELLEGAQTTRVDLLQAEVEAESTHLLTTNARNELQAAWRRLAAVLGTPHEPATRLEGEIDESLPTVLWEDALVRLLAESPEMAGAVAEVERARWALDRALVEAKPNVNVQFEVGYDDSTSDVMSGVQVAIPVPVHNQNQGNIQAARARVVAAEQDISRLELDLQRRFAAVYRRYANARQQANQYHEAILPKARETLELVELGYKAGERDYPYLTLLTAQRTLFNANLAYLDALSDVWSASVKVEGMLLTNSLAEPSKRDR
jgi:cobalt-zinc-cadmium efflux system outer membrane protein